MISIGGVNWYVYNNTLLPDIPPHEEVEVSFDVIRSFLNAKKFYFASWTSEFDSKKYYPFWYVIKDEKERLENYPKKVRYEIRKGLKNCVVSICKNPHSHVKDLYQVYRNAYRRYKNVYQGPISFDEFQKYILDYRQGDIWIVESKDRKIIAYMLTKHQIDKFGKLVVNYNVIKLHPEYLELYPSYALIFEANRYYLNEKGVLYVYDGRRSIGHETGIQDWLIKKFHFRKAYCKLNIIYRDDVRFLLRLLFPFRRFVYNFGKGIAKKLSVLLKYEEIRRQCEFY